MLLKDSSNLLIQPGKNTQCARFMKFCSKEEIQSKKNLILKYLNEAIAVEKSGLEVKFKQTKDYVIPIELKEAFQDNSELEKAFLKLTPGRQRGYLLYFGSARTERIKRKTADILAGKGINDI